MTAKEAIVNLDSTVYFTFSKHQEELRRFIAGIVCRSHDVDDVAQETFLRAYRSEAKGDCKINNAKAFLFTIAHNVAVSSVTRKSAQIVDYLEELEISPSTSIEDSPEEQSIAQQEVGRHCEAVNRLPEQCRRVYIMRKVHGLSYRQIGEQLGISPRTVENHMCKGNRLRQQWVAWRLADISSSKQ